MVIVYLSNRYIRVIDGDASGNKINAKKMIYVKDTKGCILNGTITDEEAFAETISEIWETNHLATKGVKLVIDSNQFTMKVVEAPIFKPKQMLDFISREFTDVERIENPVYGCFAIDEKMDVVPVETTEDTETKPAKGKKGKPGKEKKAKAKPAKMQRVFASMAPKALLLKYTEIFEELGIEVDGIGSALGAALRLTAVSPHQPQESGIVQMVDDMTLTSFIFVDGRYQYSSRTRLFSDVGTPEYAVEIARNVSNLLQFAKAQELTQAKIPRVLIAGLDADTYQIYKDSVEQIDSEMAVDVMELDQFVSVGQAPSGDQNLTNFVMALGGLIKTDKRTNLVVQMAMDPEKEVAQRKKKKVLVPLFALGGVMLFIVIILLGRIIYYSMQQKSLDAYNNRTDVVEDVAKYDDVSQQVSVLGTLSGSMESLQSGVLAYPKIDSSVENVITASASGLVSADINEYDSTTGIVSLAVTADNVDRIHRFVSRLSDQSVFSYVDYTGYAQDAEGKWSVNVNCTMASRGGTTE